MYVYKCEFSVLGVKARARAIGLGVGGKYVRIKIMDCRYEQSTGIEGGAL